MMVVIVPWRLLLASVILVLFTHIQGCPSVCQCTTRNGQYIVDCSAQDLSSLPSNLPIETTVLDVTDNFITDLKSADNVSAFSHLKNLISLSLSDNLIGSIPENVFQNMSMLAHLDVSDNNIQNINSNAFEGLHNLIHLDLHGNRNLQIENNTFQQMDKLEELDLSKTDNSLENLQIPSTLQKLLLKGNNLDILNASVSNNFKNLNSLDLSSNNLTIIDDFTFQTFESLTTLNLSQNNIVTLSENSFSGMPSLNTLILDNNPISELTRAVFKPLSHIQYLSISYMSNLYYLDKETFSGLRSLSTLQLSNNLKLEYIDVRSFSDLENVKLINISYNNLSALHPIMFSTVKNVQLDIQGNHFPCDCSVQWISEQNNVSNINVINVTEISCYDNDQYYPIISLEELHCQDVAVIENSTNSQAKIGSSVILRCDWTGDPNPLITWVTPRGKKLIYFGSHPLAWKSYPTTDDVEDNSVFHTEHPWHNSNSYQSDLDQYSDRLIILSNGDLFIDYMLRVDTGVYQCVVENSRNKTSIGITLHIDSSIFTEVKMWSLLIGFSCAVSFFTLNLIYALISALVRRCINQRRREAILRLVENIDQYKSAQLSRLKDNYYSQINRIRDGYHNQLERIRDNYTLQATRFKEGATLKREWASHKVDTIRDNYNSQVAKLKDNSAQKLEHLRETYNNQLLRVRDYGSSQMARVHKKYKLKQRHVMKLLETMNFDNCRQIIDSECVRAESIIFETSLTHPDLIIPSPLQSDSSPLQSDSDSAEYHTASSNYNTPISSCNDLRQSEETRLLHCSHVIQNVSSTGNNSSQLEGDNSSQVDNTSSQSNEDNSKDDIIDDINCEEIDNMLVQIQLIDESDDETEENRNSRDIEICV